MATNSELAPLAILIPCYNEAGAIGQVIAQVRVQFPSADIYVFDNNSTDNSAQEATLAGAIVRSEDQQGKGYVVRRMFADVEAQYYLMIDGDLTYDVDGAPLLLQHLRENHLDMVVGARSTNKPEQSYRRGHLIGNRMLTASVKLIFGNGFEDMLSGFRAFSRRFVKTFPIQSKGFEIETELAIHALNLGIPSAEIETLYFARAEGTASKLRTFRDGLRISLMIFHLFRHYRPFAFFTIVSFLFAVIAAALGIPIIIEFGETGLVRRFPTAFLVVGIGLCSLLMFSCGLILDSIASHQREMKRLAFISYRE
jgi:glycosyltransferase involved in cell wall biosynthesis